MLDLPPAQNSQHGDRENDAANTYFGCHIANNAEKNCTLADPRIRVDTKGMLEDGGCEDKDIGVNVDGKDDCCIQNTRYLGGMRLRTPHDSRQPGPYFDSQGSLC